MRTTLSYLLLVGTLGLGISSQLEARTIEKQFNVSSGGKLYLKTDAGRLDINTHDSDTILMEVSIEGEDEERFEVTTDVSGGDLEVIGRLEKRSSWGWSSSSLRVEYILTVPRNYSLQMHTSGGSIEIADLVGDVKANTSGGSISVGNIKGEVELKTSGGSISTEAIQGPLDAHTSGGSINVTIAEQLTEDAELHTSGGSITAYLVSDIRVDIDASTSGGRVRSDFEVDGNVRKKSIRGKINGGGPRLELHTSGGSVRIKSL